MTNPSHTQQLPQSLQAALADWARHHERLAMIDEEAARVDAELTELQRRAAELGNRHRELGVARHQVTADVEFARSMVEHGCQLAQVPMPERPPALAAPPAPVEVTPQPQQPAPAAPEPLPAGVAPIPADPDPLSAPAGATIADPPDGGGQPDQQSGDFQPQPEAEPRRRRGGRRGEQ